MKRNEFLEVFEELGLPVLSSEKTGSGHYKIRTQCEGQNHFFIAPYSTSDRRALLNFRAMVKRWKHNTEGMLP